MGRKGCGGPVPDRWMNCPRKSSDLIVNKFLAFKVPLSSAFDHDVPESCRFPPQMIFQWSKMKKIKLGLWIDLTNTSRFYNKEEVEKEGCRYIKLSCRGHGETPSEEQTRVFVNVVDEFISRNPLLCIGVHCTHGFNRTGFMIVSYLVTKMDMSLPVALEMFSKFRTPGIYKGDYIKELYRRYDDDGIEECPSPPQVLPDWCHDGNVPNTSNADMFNGSGEPESSSSFSQGGKSDGPSRKKVPQFMAGVPGVHYFCEQPKAHSLQKKVQVMCGWKSKGFPGCQPVSMDMENIHLLNRKPYRVSWKADGMRYMMLIDKDNEVYFFDRDHNVFRVEGLRFPQRDNLHRHLTNTLLDGEMVIDKVNGEDIPRYLAYDIVKIEDKDVGRHPYFPDRFTCIQKEIIAPRHQAMERGLINKQSEPFSVRRKEFWDLTQAGSLLGEKFAKTLSHEPDGLIFQPSLEPYTPGRFDEVLKWKPLDMNSIDFRLKIVKEGGTGLVTKKVCYLFVGQLDKPFAKMKYTKAFEGLDNKIVECKLENNCWVFMRERTDKSFPNSCNTAEGVLKSIQKPITKELLLNYISEHRFDDDCELMPPPNKIKRR